MSSSWKGKCLILSLLALIFISEASRSLPKAYNWEQMLPKKLPTPPSSPSKDDLHRIFKNLDTNNNGLVGVHQLHHLLQNTGAQTTLEELEEIVGHTSLDYIEFSSFYEETVKAKIQQKNNGASDDLLKAFQVFDLNSDGYISCEELQTVLSKWGLWDKSNGQDCKDMIRVFDENSDGVLDFEEFKVMMSIPCKPHKSEDA